MICPRCGKEILDGPGVCPGCSSESASEERIPQLLPYSEGGRWGFCDQDRRVAVPAVYDHVGLFSEGLARVWVDGKCGFVDARGTLVVPAVYVGVGNFHSGFAWVILNGRYGLINLDGELAVPTVCDYVGDFHDGFAQIELEGKWSFLDMKCTLVTVPTYSAVGDFHDNLASVEIGGKQGFINMKGTLVIPTIYDEVRYFEGGLAPVEINGKWGFVNVEGDLVVAAAFDDVEYFFDGLALVKSYASWGLVDTKGALIAPPVYSEIGDFIYGFAWVRTNDKWGFIDSKGSPVIPTIYDEVRDFEGDCEGDCAPVKMDGKWGYVDTHGALVVPTAYDDVAGFNNGVVHAEIDGRWGRVDSNGVALEELKKTVQEEPKTSMQLREEEVHGFLESSLRRYRETCDPEIVRLQGPSVCRRLYDFVEKRTIQTIREWFTVKSMDFCESDPDRVYVLVHSMLDERAEPVKVTDDRLVQGDVDNWVWHWDCKGFTEVDALDTVVLDLNGAAEHRRRIVELKARKDKEDRYDRVMKERVDLERVISRLSKTAAEPVDYADCHDTADEIAEESICAVFAAKLRESELDESTVFDMVSALSTLVQQSRTILPKLTAGTVKQFEARVLLPYYENLLNAWNEARHEEYLQQQRESAERVRIIAGLDLDSADSLQQITSQLSTLNTTLSDQPHDVSRIKWLELIDGLLGH